MHMFWHSSVTIFKYTVSQLTYSKASNIRYSNVNIKSFGKVIFILYFCQSDHFYLQYMIKIIKIFFSLDFCFLLVYLFVCLFTSLPVAKAYPPPRSMMMFHGIRSCTTFHSSRAGGARGFCLCCTVSK